MLQVMKFYIFKHFTPKCKVMLSYSFEFIEYMRNYTNEDLDIRPVLLENKWLLY